MSYLSLKLKCLLCFVLDLCFCSFSIYIIKRVNLNCEENTHRKRLRADKNILRKVKISKRCVFVLFRVHHLSWNHYTNNCWKFLYLFSYSEISKRFNVDFVSCLFLSICASAVWLNSFLKFFNYHFLVHTNTRTWWKTQEMTRHLCTYEMDANFFGFVFWNNRRK